MYDILLQHFLSTDELRPALTQANEVNGYVYASDGHHLVRIPVGALQQQYPAHEKTYDFARIWPDGHRKLGTPIAIHLDTLSAALKEVPVVTIYADCPTCDGEGEIECSHCGGMSDCRECDGTGESEIIVGSCLAEHPRIVLDDMALSPRLMQNLLKVMEAVKDQAYLLTIPHHSAPAWFRVGDIDVLIMPIQSTQSQLDEGIHLLWHQAQCDNDHNDTMTQ